MAETGTIKNPECVIEIDRQWKAFKSNTYSSFGFWGDILTLVVLLSVRSTVQYFHIFFSVLSSAAEKKTTEGDRQHFVHYFFLKDATF